MNMETLINAQFTAVSLKFDVKYLDNRTRYAVVMTFIR